MRVGITLIACLWSLMGWSQTKQFLAELDSGYAINRYLELNESSAEFLTRAELDEPIDLEDVDADLLSATVHHLMNEERRRKRRKPLVFSPELDVLAGNYMGQYKRYRFADTESNRRRMNKPADRASQRLKFGPGLVHVVVGQPEIANHKQGNRFYYDRKNQSTQLQLFLGVRPEKGDTTTPVAIPVHTYRSFAESAVRDFLTGRSARTTRSKSFDFMAVRVEVEKASIHRSTLPYANTIILTGAYRTDRSRVPKEKVDMIVSGGNNP